MAKLGGNAEVHGFRPREDETVAYFCFYLKKRYIGLTAYSVIMLFTLFAPKLCRKSSAFWTLVTGIIFLLIWQLVPATHIVPHPIYLAWPIAIATFLLTTVLDKRKATIPEMNLKTN